MRARRSARVDALRSNRRGDGAGLRVLRDFDKQYLHLLLHRGGKCLDGPAPLHCCVERLRNKKSGVSIDASAPTRYFQWGFRGLVVADGDEIAEDLVADVGPLLEYFIRGRPFCIADLAG